MKNEEHIDAHAALAGAGQQRDSETDAGAIKRTVEGETRSNAGEEADDRKIVRSPRSEELIRAADILVAASDSELKEAGLAALVGAAYSYQWSGMLPSPEKFNKYDADTRERICSWNDAFTIDESERQSKLVDNEIKQQNRGVILTFVLMSGFGILTFVTFLITRDVASFGFLSIPLLNVLSNLFRPAMSKSSRENAEREKSDK